MAFYIQPISGNISLRKLETFAVKRLIFLLQTRMVSEDRLRMLDLVNSLHSVAESDCLIEGTQKDNISHFILRLLFADEETEEFLVRAETNLFKFRFSCFTEEEIYKALKSSQKHISLNEGPTPESYNPKNIRHVLYTLQALKQSAGSWRNAAQNFMQDRGKNHFQLPFQSVISLVARKRVVMNRGWAQVSYDDLEEVLTSLFRSMLELALKQTAEKRTLALHDVRMRRLSRLLKAIYRDEVPKFLIWKDLPCLSCEQVDQSEALFPLCMSNLHQHLRKSHRLKHNDRIQYSLFLKEVGMPVHQAVKFWKDEYSLPSDLPGSHSWQTDQHRYVYNIRHLYGLEGARRNYRGHCCGSLQGRQLGPFEQGGCPFVHFDSHHLGNLLTANQIGEEGQARLQRLRSEGHPCDACHLYLSYKVTAHLSPHGLAVEGELKSQNMDHQDKMVHTHHSHCESDKLRTQYMNVVSDNDSSDDDVVCGKIITKSHALKRRRLSAKQNWKKQIVWYETSSWEDGSTVFQHQHPSRADSSGIRKELSCYKTSARNSEIEQFDSGHVKHVLSPERENFHPATQSNTHHEIINGKEKLNLNLYQRGVCTKGDNSSMEVSSIGPKECEMMERRLKDEESCYEHDVCLSQIDRKSGIKEKIADNKTRTTQSWSDKLQSVQILKPVDFYRCYKEILDGLNTDLQDKI